MNFKFVLSFGICTIISNVCHSTNVILKRAMFTVDGSFSGYVCIDNYALEEVTTGSVLECASLCKDSDECDGVFYQQENKTCVMCSDPFDGAGMGGLAVMLGTLFYRRNECNGFLRGFDGKEIVMHFEERSRDDAQTICQANEGQLVQIREASQMSHLSNALKSCAPSTSENFWTDGVFNSTNGAYQYSDGTAIPMGSADFWEDPDSTPGAQCVRLRIKTFDYFRWNDKSCHRLYGFICEL